MNGLKISEQTCYYISWQGEDYIGQKLYKSRNEAKETLKRVRQEEVDKGKPAYPNAEIRVYWE